MTRPVGIWGISVIVGLSFPQYLLLQEIVLDFRVAGGCGGVQHSDSSCLPLQPQHVVKVLP